MKIGLLQLNSIVGDLEQNADKIIHAARSLRGKVDLCVTSELALLGYPPRDLLFDEAFIARSLKQINVIAQALADGPALLLGCAALNEHRVGKPLYNAAVFMEDGIVKQHFYKTLIPTYDVFDEDRYFESNKQSNILHFKGKRFGITVCEDIWNNELSWPFPRYLQNPVVSLQSEKIDGVINLSASPYYINKQTRMREPLMQAWAKKYQLPFIYVNQVGGNDDLIFDGYSCFIDQQGQIIKRAQAFDEDIMIMDMQDKQAAVLEHMSEEEEVFKALVCGTRDYIQKCGFKRAVLGLSGGIDSALTLVIAAAAIGSENVIGVMMPSPYSSQGSLDDATSLADNLGVKTYTLPIEGLMYAYDHALEHLFTGCEKDTTEENLQARIRGNLLMALSNKFNALLLTTGNKSELSVGYCTIYGDMCGGLAVISDVYKTLVYRTSQWVNDHRGREIIPVSTLTKPPSAELRPDQCDQDSLPPYDILDDILYRHIELNQSAGEIVSAGYMPELVTKILNMFARAEFKRRQAAPGLKVTPRAYGSGWRMPIAARLKDSSIEMKGSLSRSASEGRGCREATGEGA
jgi:NAD+ synthetase